jgi:hypothetical protein
VCIPVDGMDLNARRRRHRGTGGIGESGKDGGAKVSETEPASDGVKSVLADVSTGMMSSFAVLRADRPQQRSLCVRTLERRAWRRDSGYTAHELMLEMIATNRSSEG